jgi:hypothetical protein
MSAVNRLAAEDCFAGLRCAKEEEAARKGPGPGAIAARKMRRWVRREEEKAWSSLSVPCSSSPPPVMSTARSDQVGAANLAPESPSRNVSP